MNSTSNLNRPRRTDDVSHCGLGDSSLSGGREGEF